MIGGPWWWWGAAVLRLARAGGCRRGKSQREVGVLSARFRVLPPPLPHESQAGSQKNLNDVEGTD